MKQAIAGMGIIILFVLIGCIITSLGIDSAVEERLEQAVSLATYQSLTESMETGIDISQCFQDNLEQILEEDSYTIDQFTGDAQRGILSATVTLSYTNFGYERQVTCQRSVIYEREEV